MAIVENTTTENVKNRISAAIADIETMFVGIIQSVDHINMKYSVQPILNRYDLVERTIIESAVLYQCPMMATKCGGFVIRAPYEVGDVVYVGVCKDSVDQSLVSNTPSDNKLYGVGQFRQIDGVILGGLMCDTEERLSEENTTDMLIQNRKNKDKIVIKADGGIELVTKQKVLVDSPETEVTGNMVVKGNVSVDGNIVGKADINISGSGTIGSVTTANGVTLDGHTHEYNPGPGAPTPTSAGKG